MGNGFFAVQTIAQNDDLFFSAIQAIVDDLHGAAAFAFSVKILCDGIINTDDIAIRQRIAVFICIDRLADGDFVCELFARTKVHEDLVRYPLLTARHILTNPR